MCACSSALGSALQKGSQERRSASLTTPAWRSPGASSTAGMGNTRRGRVCVVQRIKEDSSSSIVKEPRSKRNACIKTRLQAVRGGGAIVWKGLYKGLAGNICGVIPASAIFMGVYEPVKRAVTERGGSPLAAQFAAATLAGTAASLVRVPTEARALRCASSGVC